MAEGLVIDPLGEDAANVALNLNDGTATFLMGVDYPTPDLDSMYQGSVDTEGDPLVQHRYKNRQITARVRVDGTSAAALQTTLGYMQQKAGKLNREGGTIMRTAPSGATIAFDVVGCKVDLPIDFQLIYKNRAVVSFWFECQPFGRGALSPLGGHSETTLPVLVFTEANIPGDVSALGRLVIDEDQGANQATAIWGIQSRFYDSASSAALFYQAEGLTLQGGGAATSTAAAGYSGTGSVLANTLATQYQSILSSQATGAGAHWTHVGEFHLFARVFVPTANTGTVSVRAQWTIGDGRVWTTNPETSIATGIEGVWRIIDLGHASISQVVAGTQRWEVRLLAKSTIAGDDIHVDFLFLQPTAEGSGVASGVPAAIDYSSFQARDEFSQSAGALAGKTPNTGGNWAGAGDSDDFSVSGSGTVSRTAVSDTSTSLGNARLATMATPATLGALWARVYTYATTAMATAAAYALKSGLLLRYVDSSNLLAVVALPATNSLGQGLAQLWVIERVGGTDTIIGSLDGISLDHTLTYAVAASVDTAGAFVATIAVVDASGFPYAPIATVSGQSATLAAGGTLASGKVGIVDHYTYAGALTRVYDSFVVHAASNDAAVFASQSMELRNNMVIREDSAGTLWQRVSKYEGDYLLVPPAGREDRISRFIVKLSRGAVTAGIDGGIDDLSAELTIIPRYLVVPG